MDFYFDTFNYFITNKISLAEAINTTNSLQE